MTKNDDASSGQISTSSSDFVFARSEVAQEIAIEAGRMWLAKEILGAGDPAPLKWLTETDIIQWCSMYWNMYHVSFKKSLS